MAASPAVAEAAASVAGARVAGARVAGARATGARVVRALAAGCAGLALAGLALGAGAGAPPAAAGVDNFHFDSWDADYRISADAEGRSQARVTETITAHFPDTDVNRGFNRGLVIDYLGASTDPRDFSVVDGDGSPVPFEVHDAGELRTVAVGDNSYVHGPQTYVLQYTISDVILARDDGLADEFYWDLVSFWRLQAIEQFSATVAFDDATADALTGNVECYGGAFGSDERCAVSGAGTAADPIVIAPISVMDSQGITIAAGLEPGTFVQPPNRRASFTLQQMPLLSGGIAIASGILGSVLVGRGKRRRRVARGTIIAQYDVPAHLPPLIAGPLIGPRAGSPGAAQIVHLAVTGVTRLEDAAPMGTGSQAEPQQAIRVMDPARVGDPLDQQALYTLLPGAVPGAAILIPKTSTPFASAIAGLERAGSAAADQRGYTERARMPGAAAAGAASLALGVLAVALACASLAVRGPGVPALGLILGLAAIFPAAYALKKHHVHTPLGAEAAEWLEGTKLFIRVAEADRIRMLQSYSGAERRADGSVDVIEIYEKLLPYAMLFKLEREWAQVLAVRYEADPQQLRSWYPGVTLRYPGGVSSTITRFTGTIGSAASFGASSAGGSIISGGGSGGGGGGGYSGGGGGGGSTSGR